MNHGIRVHEFGGPEVLRFEELAVAAPGPGEVLVRNSAVGLNFIDVYFRTGRYKLNPPFVPGHEGAGVIEAVGPGVESVKVGDRVGYIDPIGSYAELVVRPARRLIRLPATINEVRAAGLMLKGMTAEYLVRRTHTVKAGEAILVHAAAGGVGQILCQWAKSLGARVLGTVGSETKRSKAEHAGCDMVIVTETEDFVASARDFTGGKGVRVVYDGVGGDTFLKSLDCIEPCGLMVAFGAASGPFPPLDVQMLAAKGSLYLTRPGLATYTASEEQLQSSADAHFSAVAGGAIRLEPPQQYPLREAAAAHQDLEARKLTGSTVLLP